MHRRQIWPRAFGPSITRNLITRVLTICRVKLTQSTAIEQKRFDLRSLSSALHNLWLLLVIHCIYSTIAVQTTEWNFIGSPRKHSTRSSSRRRPSWYTCQMVLRSSNDWHDKSPQTMWQGSYKKLQPFFKDFSRTTLDFQGQPTRNIISDRLYKNAYSQSILIRL